MRRSCRTFLLAAAAAALGCTSAATVCGCHPDDCRDVHQCPPQEVPPSSTATDPCVADPAAGPVEDRCGIFVSASLGDDDHPGTREQPVRSIERAIALASNGPMRVYACAELFAEEVLLPSGVELWGGLDCEAGWAYVGVDSKTVVAPGPDRIPLRVTDGAGASIVADLRAEAADAEAPGGSSIAAMVLSGAALELLRSELVAGGGAPGAPGEDGGAGPALPGTPGNAGANACSAAVVAGGDEVQTVCEDLTSIGAQGGQGGITGGTEGLDGQPEPVPNPQGFGLRGAGETSSVQCMQGMPGKEGAPGEHGLGATGSGWINTQGWRGVDGGNGTNGRPGQGGGGGGGRRGGTMLCGANLNRGGAGGGSGGAGGCGGRAATGGGAGGGSIGLLTLSGDVSVRSSSILTARGGDGGNGGLGQAGGPGGPAGPGGAAFNFASAGCSGGPGGSGGYGGHGGGGLGGPSIGIAHPAGIPVAQEAVDIAVSEAGKGGLGGNPSIPGTSGDDGTEGAVVPLPQ